jgi:hypothetical protein
VSIFDTGQAPRSRRSDARDRQQDLAERLSEVG